MRLNIIGKWIRYGIGNKEEERSCSDGFGYRKWN